MVVDPPLRGLTVRCPVVDPARRPQGDDPLAWAATVLAAAGARVVESGASRELEVTCPAGLAGGRAGSARLIGEAALPPDGGVAAGTTALATGLALAAAALAAWRGGTTCVVDARDVAVQVYLPLLELGAGGAGHGAAADVACAGPAGADTAGSGPAGPAGVGVAHLPPLPWPTADGAVCADLGAGGDRESFDRLLDVLGPGPHLSEELARRAQEWRLPVTPYRRLAPAAAASDSPRFVTGTTPSGASSPTPRFVTGTTLGPGTQPADPAARFVTGTTPRAANPATPRSGRPLADIAVVDLTVMWAGPLATWLLVTLGANVTKIEPACRPDGLRGSPAWFEAINRHKTIAPLDLRLPVDRERFDELITQSDVAINNFSPRVPANLGIEPATLHKSNRSLVNLAMPAFPAGAAERDWVAYGTGAHAHAGLGDCGTDHGFRAPAVTYPDPLAGFWAAATIVAALVARDLHPERGGLATETPLRAAIEPLRAHHDGGATLMRPPPIEPLARHLAQARLPDGPRAPWTFTPRPAQGGR